MIVVLVRSEKLARRDAEPILKAEGDSRQHDLCCPYAYLMVCVQGVAGLLAM